MDWQSVAAHKPLLNETFNNNNVKIINTKYSAYAKRLICLIALIAAINLIAR